MTRQEMINKVAEIITNIDYWHESPHTLAEYLVDSGVRTKEGFQIEFVWATESFIINPINWEDSDECSR